MMPVNVNNSIKIVEKASIEDLKAGRSDLNLVVNADVFI